MATKELRINVRASAATVGRVAAVKKSFGFTSDANTIENSLFIMERLALVKDKKMSAGAALFLISEYYNIPEFYHVVDMMNTDSTQIKALVNNKFGYIDTDMVKPQEPEPDAPEIPEFKRVKIKTDSLYGKIGERGKR